MEVVCWILCFENKIEINEIYYVVFYMRIVLMNISSII